ncbi:putative disease resistance RPP13-like protein 2, partial [Triticum aestivum]|uniref:putative disease resistance RPP13-like protein 2 n=1 Tax=Triticum aestivum TaxID=4565 RepID=UPI001D005719
NRRDGYKNAVGLDEDVKTLEKMLLHKDQPQQMFVSILGESGVGKKTLLCAIIGHTDVIYEFEIVVWFNMPADYTTEDLLQEIYDRACESAPQHHPNEGINIADKLRHLLKKKRYLVIIGGICSKTILNCVRVSLPDDNNGSRVVLVLDTESEEVAWHANTMNKDGINGIHMLGRLDEKRSRQLFCSRASRKELSDVKENGEMSKYSKIVYDITGGYPLAIVLLAGLLRFKEKPGQWEAVLQQLRLIPRMEDAQGVEENKITESVLSKGVHIEWQMSPITKSKLSTRTTTIERVFWASFEDIPNDLKSCFLYLAAIPKNTTIYTDEVVRIWMAEGFIKPQQGKTLEELGHAYLKELVLRCLVHIDKMNDVGIIEKVVVHQSLYGFLHSEAREAGFMDVHGMHDVFVPPSVRRLSFMSFKGGHMMRFTNKFCKLRSIICWVQEKDRSNDGQGVNQKRRHDLKFLCGSKFIRVISVHGLWIKEVPNEIGRVVHLRYLNVSGCKDLKKLPSSIKSLLNLQTLDITGTQVKEIHPSFWKIKTLRHVFADELTLPASIKEELEELQTLWGVKPAPAGEWVQGNCPLHKMTKLRTLGLQGFKQSKHGAALESALRKMSLLHHLDLTGDEIPSCVFTAQNLRCLEMVGLRGTIKWPEVVSDVRKVRPNLVRLTVVKGNGQEVPEHIKDQLHGILEVSGP